VGTPALAEAIARIESRYGMRAVVRGDVAERQDGERRITAGTSLDAVTGGGIRAGEPLAFVGPLTSGKQALALTVAAAAQREGGMAAWIDPSASFDPLAALRAGIDLDRLVVIRAASVDEVVSNIRSMGKLASWHGMRVIIGSVLPASRDGAPVTAVDELNRKLAALAQSEGYEFVDYYRALDKGDGSMAAINSGDGVHPTEAGYARMRPLAVKAIASVR